MDEGLFVRLVSAYGPGSRSKIARRLGVSPETVVRGLARLAAAGLEPRPDIRMGKLGLQRVAVTARPGQGVGREEIESLFDVMGDYAYLEHFQKLDPSASYLLLFTLPPAMLPQLNSFLMHLQEGGMLSSGVPAPLGWTRYHSIRGPWKGGAADAPATSGPLTYVPDDEGVASAPSLDHRGVLLLAAMQGDPSANFDGLLERVRGWSADYHELSPRLSEPRAAWRDSHAEASKLVRAYPMHLARGPVDAASVRRHRWASFTMLWEGLSAGEIRRAAMASTSIPYLRTDGAGQRAGVYFAVFSAPTALIPSYLDFMSKNAPDGRKVAFPSHHVNYSIPFPSYSIEEEGWAWKKERLLELATAPRQR